MNYADPFSSRFEVFGREHNHRIESINREAIEELRELLKSGCGGDGRVIVLQAPRAGYGKTSVLQSLYRDLGEDHQFVRVRLTGGRTTDAAHVLEYVLQALCEVVSGSTTLTRLDLLSRQILALGLEPLVASGEVPCQDRESALAALRDDPAQTFDFHHDGAATAHWTKSNFEVLGPRLAAELSRASGASLRESSYWVELLFRFATTPPDNVERARLLFETIFRNDLQSQSSSTAEERLHGLLALCGTVISPVLIIDDTEGLSTSPPDALALASFLSNISQCCPGTVVLLSVNDDIWESSFMPLLPGGLADRLLAHKVTLKAITRAEAEVLIAGRAGEDAAEVLTLIDWTALGEEFYPRKVLKVASDIWQQLERPSTEESPDDHELQQAEQPDPLADLPEFGEPHFQPERAPAHLEQPVELSVEQEPEVYPVEEPVPVLTPESSAVYAIEDPIDRPNAPGPSEAVVLDSREELDVPLEVEEIQQPTGSIAAAPSSPRIHSPFEVVPDGPDRSKAPEPASPREEQESSPNSSPTSPFAAVTPAFGSPFASDPDPSDEPAKAAPVEQHDVEEDPERKKAAAYSPPSAGDPDPTRGEIEFSKLRPLSETPPAGTFPEQSPVSSEPEPDEILAPAPS